MKLMLNKYMVLVAFIACSIILCSGCASPKKLLELEQEIDQVKTTVEVLEKSNVEMNMKLDELTETVKRLEESIQKDSAEKSSFKKEKSSDFTVDQIYVPESKPPESSTTEPSEKSETSVDDYANRDAHQLYNLAFNHYKNGVYGKAILEFEEFASRFPEHNLADNAQYWIGEIYYSQKDYNRAIYEFQKVLDLYPLGNKVPDAMLKIGLAYKELREYKKALDQFQKVLERFPDSDAAIKAKEQVEIIRSEQ